MPKPEPDRAATLWDRHADEVFAYAWRRIGATAAPDIVADVFAVVVAHPERVPDDALPWLYRVAWNVMANARRADGRRSSLVKRLQARDIERSDDPGAMVSERAEVIDALVALSAVDREALLLVAWEGLDNRRAAAATGCSVGAFAVRLHRARRRLEAALHDARLEIEELPQ